MALFKGRYEEFQEEDVWGVPKSRERKISNFTTSKSKGSSGFISRPLPSASRMIPMPKSSNSVQESRFSNHSAPVSVPDWSKIYGSYKAAQLSSRAPSWDEDGGGDDEEEEEDEGGGDPMVPPHELIDRRLARKQISSFSMCEGVGRTLKGRDLSRVRNSILTKTGFIE